MNQLQHLLIKLAEECSEVAQIALKTAQFGTDEIMPGQPLTNAQRCYQELDDLLGIVEMLNERYGFGYAPSEERMLAKAEKVDKYLEYSIQLGQVNSNT